MTKQRNKVSVVVVEPQIQSTQSKPPAQGRGEEIAQLAYNLWQARGCPHGSPQDDWFAAEREMQVMFQRRHIRS